jgi:hypothetical protein
MIIIPLGTGNDTARQFGWGNKWEGAASMMNMLKHGLNAPVAPLDRYFFVLLYQLLNLLMQSVDTDGILKSYMTLMYLMSVFQVSQHHHIINVGVI